MSKLISINPSDYQQLGEVEVSTTEEISQKVTLAHEAKTSWRQLGVEGRVKLLRLVIEEFRANKESLAILQAKEMGMPYTDALIDVDGDVDYATWYCDNAAKYLSPETTFESDKEIHQVFFEPIGVIASIVPWNFPLANVIWACFQGLVAGNTVVLKHSEECPLSGKLIESLINKHLPVGVFNGVYGDGEVGKILVNENINMITFTGSTKTGKYLFELAGTKFIKSVMELGGSAPGIVFADADINLAVENVSSNRLLNQGQCCDGLKRLMVEEKAFEEVVSKLSTNFTSKIIGNAQDPSTQIGPLVAKRQLDLLISQVEDAVSKGATIICGGHSLEDKLGGAYFEPTILTNVTSDMRVWTEEVFGPVLPVMKFTTADEALALANGTIYGLGSYLYTSNKATIDTFSSNLEAGMVNVNGTNYVLPFNPFGGYKNSGFGREHGRYGFAEVTQIKVVSRNI